MASESTHFDESGQPRMVDIAAKPESFRVARASGRIRMEAATATVIRSGGTGKGDVLAVARLGGIAGAKQAALLIPLCHPVRLTAIGLDFRFVSETELAIEATVSAVDRTGVEMEALAAVTSAALTVYDMCKSIDRAMEIGAIRLEEKSGGRSGHYRRQG
jgi:cyclic pyranopterin monophosphate synthase